MFLCYYFFYGIPEKSQEPPPTPLATVFRLPDLFLENKEKPS
jgi:hypothetical protein